MTVGELIEKLKQHDPEMPVIKQSLNAEYGDWDYSVDFDPSVKSMTMRVHKRYSYVDWVDSGDYGFLSPSVWDMEQKDVVTI